MTTAGTGNSPTTRRLPELLAISLILAVLHRGTVIVGDSDVLLDDDKHSCGNHLGMQSGAIPDSAITASSSYDQKSVGPLNARIRTEKHGGAWCPRPQISKDVYEWLEIDLGELKVVSMVETQGRFGNGQGQEFAPNYLLEYQRESGQRWIRFRDRKGMEMFRGNENTYRAELRTLAPPIITRRLRFVPYSSHPRTVCMRVEIYGCSWPDGIVSYNMRQGDHRGTEMDFYDFTYDGMVEHGYLSGGLGQLTDLEEGIVNFELDIRNFGRKGYGWVAWRNDTSYAGPVEIIFKFDEIRNFSAVYIVASNVISKEVSVFSRAVISFSIGGEHYISEPVIYEQRAEDATLESARPVFIPIPGHSGRFAKVVLSFGMKWIMISEIRFFSEPALVHISTEMPLATTSSVPPLPFASSTVNLTLPKGVGGRGVQEHIDSTSVSENEDYALEYSGPEAKSSNHNRLDDAHIGIIISALAAFILLIIITSFVVVCQYRRLKRNSGAAKTVFTNDRINFDTSDLNLPNGKHSNGTTYSVTFDKDAALAISDANSIKKKPVIVSSAKMGSSDPEDSSLIISDYIALQLKQSAQSRPEGVQPNPVGQNRTLSPAAKTSNGCLSPNLCPRKTHLEDDVYGKEHNGIRFAHKLSKHLEFPKERLKFVEKIGNGIYGEIQLYEWNPEAEVSSFVAFKTLDPNASDQTRNEFFKDVDTMMKLQDANIVQVLGVCTKDLPVAVVIEYPSHGDLHQFLLNPGCTVHHSALSYGCLVYLATQIASGMKFLETHHMVHRDLATRNCLVGTHYTVKISDLGRSRPLYNIDYYQGEGNTLLPIRWMAWESITMMKFSCKSDAWAFAVTLWEILTLAREFPFAGLADHDVLENARHHFKDTGHQVYLRRPSNCHKEIFDLMMECWNREETRRPSFPEIHLFLQQKNLGYNPEDG